MDCSLADLAGKKDGEWVTVGGMIAECKRIRTKKGDPMMFATLDDLEGQVELLVFNSAYAANADKVDVDKLVIVRGPRGPQGGGGDQAGRAGGRAVRPLARRRCCGAAEAAVTEAVVRRLTLHVARRCPTPSSRSSRRSSATTRASTSCCWRWASAG